MIETFRGYIESPIGLIEIEGTSEAIIRLDFVDERRPQSAVTSIIEEAVEQVRGYLAGTRREFQLPLQLAGTDFQRMVWRHLLTVPYGCTASYGGVARAIRRPKAVRAVGAANGRNPIAIIVPCHRILGTDGSLTGYGGGLWRKEWLLRHEGWSA